MPVLKVLLRSLIIETAMDKFLTNVWWNLCARPKIQAKVFNAKEWMEKFRWQIQLDLKEALKKDAEFPLKDLGKMIMKLEFKERTIDPMPPTS